MAPPIVREVEVVGVGGVLRGNSVYSLDDGVEGEGEPHVPDGQLRGVDAASYLLVTESQLLSL